jgi:NADP-dependent 3-hydroxy acid dehydrogenase YdfG
MALHIAKAGISVAAWDRDEAALKALGAETAALGLAVKGWKVDISNRASVYAAARQFASSMPAGGHPGQCAGHRLGQVLHGDPRRKKIERPWQ